MMWVGLLGALVMGPVYGLSRPGLLDRVILLKVALAVLLLVVIYRLGGSLESMEPSRRPTLLLGVLGAWVALLLLGVEAAHP